MAKILVIDDEKPIRNTLREILEYEKFKVDDAPDGMQGIEKISKNKYDIILCDIKMPEMDGIEVLEKAQSITHTPIVMISGHGNIETAVEAIKKGAFDYIAKPLDLNRLLITIRNALDKSNLINETQKLKRQVSKAYEMVGESEEIIKIKGIINKLIVEIRTIVLDKISLFVLINNLLFLNIVGDIFAFLLGFLYPFKKTQSL